MARADGELGEAAGERQLRRAPKREVIGAPALLLQGAAQTLVDHGGVGPEINGLTVGGLRPR